MCVSAMQKLLTTGKQAVTDSWREAALKIPQFKFSPYFLIHSS